MKILTLYFANAYPIKINKAAAKVRADIWTKGNILPDSLKMRQTVNKIPPQYQIPNILDDKPSNYGTKEESI